MGESMRRASDRMPANSIRAELDSVRGSNAIARIAANPSDFAEQNRQIRTVAELVVHVNGRLGRSQKEFAIAGGCAESDLSNALKSRQRLDMQWVFNQDDAYVAAFIDEWRADRGLDSARVDALEAREIAELVERVVYRGFRDRRPEERRRVV